ncbi:ABC transporter permease [Celeribacter indicus]|uniref:Nitrate/sulfonate/bicarbonate ABC transporter permease n=1 Tax=Celeribacter indicus TaxID=1208324 RepID=A0A0B5E8F7_9RHOB|nr:ABC transporter permease subunit [Celeribacter indicus]AJE48602.1 nitrate/sulfonate/bicarbonate ABC transporter permease [Celeribacter indicus]SDX09478.1 NitT/TauT family transport system permease protein [Celeribacter indicus]
MTSLQKQVWAYLALLLLIPAWFLAHQNTTFIESPVTVAKELPHFLSDPATWTNIGITLARVVLGLLLGVVAGFVAAFAMTRSRLLGDVLSYYVTAALRTPSAIAAILALAIFKGSEAGYVLVVAFITFPYMAVGLRDGLASADRELDEMAQVYHLGLIAQIRHIWAPYVAPYIFAALRNAHALAWKVIVVAEIFGAAKTGFGAQFEHAWGYMLMTEVHLWLLVFMAIVLFAEYGLIRTAEKYVFRWR